LSKFATFCCTALLLAAVACGSGSSGGSCTSSNATDLASQDQAQIQIHSFAFQPSCFEATSTQGIKIVNQDQAPHTFTVKGTSVDLKIDAGKTIEQGPLGLSPGTYPFVCTIHPQMTGTIIIK